MLVWGSATFETEEGGWDRTQFRGLLSRLKGSERVNPAGAERELLWTEGSFVKGASGAGVSPRSEGSFRAMGSKHLGIRRALVSRACNGSLGREEAREETGQVLPSPE